MSEREKAEHFLRQMSTDESWIDASSERVKAALTKLLQEEHSSNDLRLQNGLKCIDVDDVDKTINIIVPEDWKVTILATDSGQELNVELKSTAREGSPKSFAMIRPKRVESAPTFERSKAGEG